MSLSFLSLTSIPSGWGTIHFRSIVTPGSYDAEQFSWKLSRRAILLANASLMCGFGAPAVAAAGII